MKQTERMKCKCFK